MDKVTVLFNEKKPLFSYENSGLEWLVRMAGFEPTTLWFVARYSIQLSYIRVKTVESKYYALLFDLANKTLKIP